MTTTTILRIAATGRGDLSMPGRGPAWMFAADRSCAPVNGTPQEAFTSEEKHSRTQAKNRCINLCPYRLECLDYAVEHDERHGIWGGVDFSSIAERARGKAVAA
jgi:hypothetical protein